MQDLRLDDMHHLGGGRFCFEWDSVDDVRSYRPPVGFSAVAECIDVDPVTQGQLDVVVWWLFLVPDMT